MILYLALCFTAVLASRDEANRNILHFSNDGGWQGPPAALMEINQTLHLYYEQPLKSGEVTGSTQIKLAHASSKDGITWKDENSFIENTAGESSDPSASYQQGGIVKGRWPNLGLGKDVDEYLVVFNHVSKKGTKDEYHSARNRFSLDGMTALTGKVGLDLPDTTAVDAFTYYGKTFLATIAFNQCNVEFLYVTGYPKNEEFETNPAGSFKSNLPGACRSVQVIQFDDFRWIIALSHQDPTTLTTRTMYWYGDLFFLLSNVVRFREWHSAPFVLDYGHDAQDFKFAKFNGNLIAIGWNGNQRYQDNYPTKAWKNAVTVPRIIGESIRFDPTDHPNVNVILGGPLYQIPLDFASKAVKTNQTIVTEHTTLTSSCVSVDLSKASPQNSEAFIFTLKFQNIEVLGVGYTIEFSNGNEILDISFNKSLSETRDKYQFSVDRSKTNVAWAAGRTLTYGEGHMKLYHTTIIILDKSTVEVFGLDGSIVFTESYFLNSGPFTTACIKSVDPAGEIVLRNDSSYATYSSIWKEEEEEEKEEPSPSPAFTASGVGILTSIPLLALS